MPDILTPGSHPVGTQFVTVDGVLLHDLCGPWSLTEAEAWATQGPLAPAPLFHRMRAAGRCDPQGTSTLANLRSQALADNFQVAWLPYREPMPEATWRAFLGQYVGKAAILVQVANGQALKDSLSGQGEDAANLKYHFLTLFGEHPQALAWWAGDGCNGVYNPVKNGVRTRIYSTQQLVLYADETLAAARPVGALAILPKVTFGGVPVWKQGSDKFWTDDKGHRAGPGVGQYLSDHGLLAVDGLAGETFYTGSDSFLPLANGGVVTAHKQTQNGKQVWVVRNDEGAALLATYFAKSKEQPPTAPAPAGSPLGDQLVSLIQEITTHA